MAADADHVATRSEGKLAVVVAYAIFASLWILFSDELLGMLVTDHELLVRASIAKGWAFVAVTALLLYGLVARLVGHIDAAHQRQRELEHELRIAATAFESQLGMIITDSSETILRVSTSRPKAA